MDSAGAMTEEAAESLLISTPAEGVLLLTINRPRKANSLSVELVDRLCGTLEAARADDAVRCIVLTGSDKLFSAGSDISGMVERGIDWYLDETRIRRWFEIQDFPKPIVAAVNGGAIGGGCELAMLCDIVIAGETAFFAQGEINIGTIPGDGGSQRLPRHVGKSLAMQMILTGERISAGQALAAGLVSEVVEPEATVARAVEIASLIAAKAPLSVQLAKRSALAAFSLPLDQGLLFERQMVVETFKTEDRAEGMRAFLEKRSPVYRGR